MFEIVNDRICWYRLYEYIRYKVICEILFSYFKSSFFKILTIFVHRIWCTVYTA
jgi:hypothetical protein